MKFTKETLEELELPWSAIERTHVGKSRWSDHYEIVFEHNGKHYRTSYSQGSTENQDERPWEYEKEVDCEEVQQVEKVIKVWEPVS